MTRTIVLAAGRGSRLGNLTQELPKGLVELDGAPLLDRQIAAFSRAGIEHVAIVRGYKGEKFPYLVHYFENRRWSETNSVASLLAADDWLMQYDCLVTYADVIYSDDIFTTLDTVDGDIVVPSYAHWRESWDARYNDPLTDLETFRTSPDGRLVEIGGKPGTLDEIEGQFMGMVRFTPKGWLTVKRTLASLSAERVDSLDVTSLLRMLIASGIAIQTTRFSGWWFEIDNETDLAVAKRQLTM